MSEEKPAPIVVMLEAWPEEMRGKATITTSKGTHDIVIKSSILALILGYLGAR